MAYILGFTVGVLIIGISILLMKLELRRDREQRRRQDNEDEPFLDNWVNTNGRTRTLQDIECELHHLPGDCPNCGAV